MTEWAEALADSGKTIIVEGKKDERALRALGIEDIRTLSKRPIFEVIETVVAESSRVVILTDFDKEGKKLYGLLSSGLQAHGVEIDNVYREWLQKNTKIKNIEGLMKSCPCIDSSYI